MTLSAGKRLGPYEIVAPIGAGGMGEVYRAKDTRGNAATRLTFYTSEEAVPLWSFDGTKVAYRSSERGVTVKTASGLQHEQVWYSIQAQSYDAFPSSWTPDGKGLIFTSLTPKGGERLMIVHEGETTGKPLLEVNASQSSGHLSGDGKWLAYSTDESGRWEVYVTTFPAAEGKWQVSQDGGTEPRWRRDGKELFYISGKGMLMAAAVQTTATFTAAVPQPLFALRARSASSSTDRFSYDVTKDGKKFLVNRYVPPAQPAALEMVTHVTATVEKK